MSNISVIIVKNSWGTVMRNIVVVEAISTGYNLIEDIVQRGYNPIVVNVRNTAGVYNSHRDIYKNLKHLSTVVDELEDYDKTLEMIRGFDPVLVVPGNEGGVVLATMLADDLGLPGNPKSIIPQMTCKDKMHEALKNAGIRYIRGKVVNSVEEATEYCALEGITAAVVKPMQSAGSNGLHLCDTAEEVIEAVKELLTMEDYYGRPITSALIQERIYGTEYIVNTASCNGEHKLNSILRYAKKKTNEGGYVYDYGETIGKLEPGHAEMVEYAFKVADAIGYKYGLIHGEYMIDDKGPVLIEVNCRPMGASMPAEYLDKIFGHHETDCLLDCFLYPEKFKEDREKPYRPVRKGVLKMIIIPEDSDIENHPLWEVGKQLRSTFKIAAGEEYQNVFYPKTRDLETNGGVVYLLHDDESVVNSDLKLLRQIEKNYFQLLLNDGMSRRWVKDQDDPDFSYEKIIEQYGCKGSILIASDDEVGMEGVCNVTPDTLYDANPGFDYVIIGYQNKIISLNEAQCLKLMFDTLNLVRPGGKVLIPENAWKYFSYNRHGAEEILIIKGFTIEPPLPWQHNMVIGTHDII